MIKQQESDRLNSILFRLIEQENGAITILNFAMEAKISGEKAKQFLDEKAKEFNARFEVSQQGNISYQFDH